MNQEYQPAKILSNQPLSESERLSYLKAMGIDCWVPNSYEKTLKPLTQEMKVPLIEQALKVEASEEQPKHELLQEVQPEINKSNNDESNVNAANVNASSVNENSVNENSENANKDNASSLLLDESLDSRTLENSKVVSRVVIDPLELVFNPEQQIKLLSWSNQNLKDEGAKKLLILCRHQVDQPANSFARSNEPSQFMQDYINSLLALVEEQPFGVQVQLAHLTQAGLGSKNLSLKSFLENAKIDLVLVLGDETIKQLSHSQIETAKLRSRFISLGNQKAIVSYHPFSMIKNSSLKPLAMEDINLIAHYLSSNTFQPAPL